MARKRHLALALAMLILPIGTVGASSVARPASESARAIWKLERAYWGYVQKNDLSEYRSLWHRNFLGWPSVNAAPVHRGHITDWITSKTSRGLTFKMVEFKPAALQVTGDIAVACYWVKFQWLDRDGKGPTYTLRITHTWVRVGNAWKIIGGMSMPETAAASKSAAVTSEPAVSGFRRNAWKGPHCATPLPETVGVYFACAALRRG